MRPQCRSQSWLKTPGVDNQSIRGGTTDHRPIIMKPGNVTHTTVLSVDELADMPVMHDMHLYRVKHQKLSS